LNYEPGDHVGVCPMNRTELVDGILEKLTGVTNPDEILQLQVLNEKHTSNGKVFLLCHPLLLPPPPLSSSVLLTHCYLQAFLKRGRTMKKYQHAR